MTATATTLIPHSKVPNHSLGRFQFSLKKLFCWMAYLAIAGALFRVGPLWALLFCVWVIPGISRFQAVERVGWKENFLLYRGGRLLACLMLEVAWSYLALLVSLVFACPAMMVAAIACNMLPFVEAVATFQIVELVGLIVLLAIYVTVHCTVRQLTWPNQQRLW